jgi:hypothetical protein
MAGKVTIPKAELTPFDLPSVCIVTGSRENVTFHKVNFVWIPPAARLSIVFCGMFGLIAMLVMQKKVEGQLPFSEQGWTAWRNAKIVALVGVLVGLFTMLGALALVDSSGAIAGIFGLAGFVLLIVAVLQTRGKGPLCTRIDDTDIDLTLPSAQAADAFVERLRGGKALDAAPVDIATA